jgi:hypothetical protein
MKTTPLNWMALLILACLQAQAQTYPNYPLPDFPKDEFIMPMNVPMNLSGNFGETRKSHFHMGIDIKTNEREGEPVVAVGDGYISRINVSAFGYGNALYITHPNGYTSVYGHLQEFSAPIKKLLREEQYKRESFSVDINLTSAILPVKKGEKIALSGNSGGSGGPHLHFEIRDAQERPINPFHFGYKVVDNVAPVVNAIQLYNLETPTYPKSKNRVALQNVNGVYSPSTLLIKLNAKKIGVSLNTFDKMTNSTNSLGVYSITLFKDDSLLFEYKNDRHTFDEKRMIIAHLDYEIFLTESFRAFHKSFKESGNKLSAYPTNFSDGAIDISDGRLYMIEMVVADFNGNKNTIRFDVQYDGNANFFSSTNPTYNIVLRGDTINTYEDTDVKLRVPPSCLIDETPIIIKKTTISATVYSQEIQINTAKEHLLDNYDLQIKTSIPESLQSKAVIIWKDQKGKNVIKKATIKNAFAKISPREFGTFYVGIDTTAPSIIPLTFTSTKAIGSIKKWSFRIQDSGSGIESYKAYIDGQWVLAEYDAKFNHLAILNENKLANGKHKLRLIVLDANGNEKVFEKEFLY